MEEKDYTYNGFTYKHYSGFYQIKLEDGITHCFTNKAKFFQWLDYLAKAKSAK